MLIVFNGFTLLLGLVDWLSAGLRSGVWFAVGFGVVVSLVCSCSLRVVRFVSVLGFVLGFVGSGFWIWLVVCVLGWFSDNLLRSVCLVVGCLFSW